MFLIRTFYIQKLHSFNQSVIAKTLILQRIYNFLQLDLQRFKPIRSANDCGDVCMKYVLQHIGTVRYTLALSEAINFSIKTNKFSAKKPIFMNYRFPGKYEGQPGHHKRYSKTTGCFTVHCIKGLTRPSGYQ